MKKDVRTLSTIFLLNEIIRLTKKQDMFGSSIPIGCVRCAEDMPTSYYRSDYGDLCHICAEANNEEKENKKAKKYPWADMIIELYVRGFCA